MAPQKCSFEKSNGARVGLVVSVNVGETGESLAVDGNWVGLFVGHIIPTKHVIPCGQPEPRGHSVAVLQFCTAAS